MFGNVITKIVCFALKNAKLSISNRALLTTCLLDKLTALPLGDMIKTDDQGRLVVNNRVVTLEVAARLRESARAAKVNFALNFIHEQVLYAAIVHGVHKLETPEQSYFSRAAIWWGQQEKGFIARLAGEDASELDAS